MKFGCATLQKLIISGKWLHIRSVLEDMAALVNEEQRGPMDCLQS